jgi:hypothetical protein
MFQEQVSQWRIGGFLVEPSPQSRIDFLTSTMRNQGRGLPADFTEFLVEVNGCGLSRELGLTFGESEMEQNIDLHGYSPPITYLHPGSDALADWQSIGLRVEEFLEIAAGEFGIFVLRVQEPNLGEVQWWSNDTQTVEKVADSFTEFFKKIGPVG